ncbi:ribosome maturation factor RimP [Angustibacter luteus]|uniref:Ribosome maturation factor RimP n=1 Tax=Angustibacter luteus TaxID=658456 RepID=A0ABW1JL38_9ACTN
MADSVRQTLEPVVQGLGLALEEVSVSSAGSRRVLRVVLDSPDPTDGRPAQSPTLDSVAEASRGISAVLDSGDVMGQAPYVLEVSTPGVDRPLTLPRHFARNLQRLVEVTLTDGSSVSGRVSEVGESLALEVAGAKKGSPTKSRTLAWEEVARGQVQVEFRRLDDAAEDAVDDGADGADDAVDDEDGE